MTVKEIKTLYKDYNVKQGEKNFFVSHNYGDGNGKVLIIVNACKGYGKTVTQVIRVKDGAELLKNGSCRPCDNLKDSIDVAGEMINGKE